MTTNAEWSAKLAAAAAAAGKRREVIVWAHCHPDGRLEVRTVPIRVKR